MLQQPGYPLTPKDATPKIFSTTSTIFGKIPGTSVLMKKSVDKFLTSIFF